MQSQSITVDVLREVAERMIGQWPESKGRIERGVLIALLGEIQQVDALNWQVGSQTEPGQSYTVVEVPLSCTCPDQPRAPGGLCKHIWAVDLLSVASQRQRVVRARQAQHKATGARVALAFATAAREGWRP